MELAPEGIDVMLLVIHTGKLHQMIPDRRMRPVGANHEVKGNLDLRVPFMTLKLPRWVLLLEPSQIASKVGSGQLVIEMECDVGKVVELIQETLVEPRTIDGADGLAH